MKHIDIADIWTYAGLVVLGIGFWMIDYRLALVIVGSLLFICGIDATRRKGAHKWTDLERSKLGRLGSMRILGLKEKVVKLAKK